MWTCQWHSESNPKGLYWLRVRKSNYSQYYFRELEFARDLPFVRFSFCFVFNFYWNIVTLQCYFLLYSKVNQLSGRIYALCLGFPLYLDHQRALSRVLWCTGGTWCVYVSSNPLILFSPHRLLFICLFLFITLKNFNWRLIALQCWVSFCCEQCESALSINILMSTPSRAFLPPPRSSQSTELYFTLGSVYMLMLLSQFVPPSPSPALSTFESFIIS